jgi:microcystin-dependent protein
MSEPFIAEIRAFPYNFAPRNWALCAGQLLSIAQNTALFSLVGTTYGGNGQTTFALPDLRGRAAMGVGNGPGLTPRVMGENDGSETVTLISTQMPSHTHTTNTRNFPANETPYTNVPATGLFVSRFIYHTGSSAFGWKPAPVTAATLHPQTVQLAGGSQPHNNLQPFLAMGYYIALYGVFPARN